MSSRVKCYLCGKKARQAGISLHTFPKDGNTCSIWKQICNLRIDDDVSNVKICGNHFNQTDFKNLNVLNFGGRLALKRDAIPSICVPFPIKQRESSIITKQEECLVTIKKEECSVTITPKECLDTIAPIDPLLLTIKDEEYLATESSSDPLELVTEKISDATISNDTLECHYHITEIFDHDYISTLWEREQSVSNSPVDSFNSIELVTSTDALQFQNRPKGKDAQPACTSKRKFYHPRYVNEIKSSDVSTPKGAKLCLHLAKNTIQKQNRRIKSLQQRNRRLDKKLRSLKELIYHLNK